MLPGVKQQPFLLVSEDDDPLPRGSALSWGSRIVVAILVAAAVVLIAIKPVGVFGWDAGSLSSSLTGELGEDFGIAECRQTDPSTWLCSVQAARESGPNVEYQAFPGENGCWTAQPVEWDPRPGPTASGCIDLWDLIDAVG